MSQLSDLHNELAPTIVRQIVKPTLEAGGSFKDVLVLLESVIAGTIGVVGNGGGDAQLIDAVAEASKERVVSMRGAMKRAMI